MTIRDFQTRAEAMLVAALLGVLRRLGPVSASNLGGFVARRLGPLLPVSRVALDNLQRVMPELAEPERVRIMRAVWDNIGRTAAEFPHLARLDVTIVGAEHVRNLPDGPTIARKSPSHTSRSTPRRAATSSRPEE